MNVRVRLVDDAVAELTVKKKLAATTSANRSEENQEISVAAAKILLEHVADGVIDKFRYPYMGWDFDQFRDIYTGIIIAEIEFLTPEDAAELIIPKWLGKVTEVTGRISNAGLAELATKIKSKPGLSFDEQNREALEAVQQYLI
jgi:CYTH domain-containing protein